MVMTDPSPRLPPFVFAILFEGAPITCRLDFEGCREYLADVIEDHAGLYSVWALDTEGEASTDRTAAFVEDWAKCFDFGDGDDPAEILRPYPEFIRAFIGDKLIAAYRAAQEAA
jgi:hypothetical protein